MGEEVILLIDDAAALSFVLSFDLKRKGYKPFSARKGEEGIGKAKEKKPDLILLDILLGRTEMDGYEVLSKLKQDDDTKNIPVLMTTALSEREDIRKALNMGAAGYLVKPFGFNELLAKVEEILGK